MRSADRLLAALLTLFTPALARAYVLMAEQGEGSYWNLGDVQLQFRFGPSPTLLDGSTWNASAQAALDAWNQHMTVLRLVGNAAEGTSGGDHNGVNEAFFAANLYGQSFGPGVAAVTLVAMGGNPTRNTEVEVVFNSAMRWDSYRGPLQSVNGQTLLDFRRVALHEFGHVIGLGHPDQFSASAPSAIMNSVTGDLEALTADDIAGAGFLYGLGEAPAFIEQPALNVIPSLGTDIYFSCTVRGTPPFSYELYHDGQFAGAGSTYQGLPRNSALFYVSFSRPSDFGTYRIDLINRVGRVSTRNYSFNPDPKTEPVTFVSDLNDLTIARGEPSSLSVTVTGQPAPTFRWFQNGRELPDRTGCVLPLQGIPDDAGVYEVWATNAAGVRKSRAAKLTVLPTTYAPAKWTLVQPAVQPFFTSDLAYGNGVFVAVGYDGVVLTSSDGLQWTRRNLGTAVRFNVVVFAKGRFVVGGEYDPATGTPPVFVSYDGIGWSRAEVTEATNAIINDIAYGNDQFVAVDLYGHVLVSPDGFTWNVSTWRAPTGDFLDAIAFGNGVFVTSGRKDRVWTSTDGLQWTEHHSGVATGMSSLAFGNGRFVGAGRLRNTMTDKALIGVSADGTNWSNTMVQSARGGPYLAFLEGWFHLYGDSSHLLSTNGLDWEQRNFTTHNVSLLGFGEGRYVALNAFGERWTSGNGVTWAGSGGSSGLALSTVAFGNNRFVLFDQAQFSEDGIQWQPMQVADLAVKSAAFGGGVWIAVGRSIGRSTDGRSWSTVLSAPQAALASVTYGAGRFVAVGYRSWAGSGGTAYSSDGAAWTELAPAGAPQLRGVTYGPGGFVAVGAGGTILQSPDGVTWQSRVSHTTKELHAVTWDGTRYIAVGGDGYGTIVVVAPGTPVPPNATLCTSTDGLVWSAATLPNGEVLCSVAAMDGLVVAGGRAGLTLFSTDHGETWNEGPRAPNEIWRLAAGQGIFLATSNSNPSNLLRLTPDALVPGVRFGSSPHVTRLGADTIVSFETTGSTPTTVTWYRGNSSLALSSGTTWKIPSGDLAPGVYFAEFGGVARRAPVVLAPAQPDNFTGDVTLVQADIHHSNGNLYDQYLLTGPSAQIRAITGKVARISFRDLNEDIVQVEFSGAGALSIILENPSGPGRPVNYNQNVDYVKGHAQLYLSDADETTNVSVFSVGTLTAVNQSLFKPGITYDGIADIALLAIHSRNGRFGGARLGNASIWDRTGVTGLWAPDTTFVGPIVLGDLAAYDTAAPGLLLRSASSVTIAGGDLGQPNGRSIAVDGTPLLQFSAGVTSHDGRQPAQRNAGRFTRDGVDVTALMAPSPSPGPFR